jgi:hypothetical protein
LHPGSAPREAELLGDSGVGPERTTGAVGGEVQEEEERHLLEAQLAEVLAQSMIDPGEVASASPTVLERKA